MRGTENTVEKRKHKRLEAQKDTYIALVNESTKVGQIINISKSGLAFRYFFGEDDYNKLFDLDILFVQDSFYLKKVPVNTVWVSHAVSKPSLSLLKSKEQGLQFEELTPHQISQLDFFLQNYTHK